MGFNKNFIYICRKLWTMAASRRMPAGVQDFETMRTGGFVYVDKTQYVYDLANRYGNAIFLSRPRRFGKSLLCSTMKYYFQGRRDLFVMELKTDQGGTVDDALAQIDQKNYLIPYWDDPREKVKVGVVMDRESRTLKDWKVAP